MHPSPGGTPRPFSDPERRPRPEARELQWEELEGTTQEAFQALIQWLTAAVASNSDSRPASPKAAARTIHEQLATSVLIGGDRGSGKTTLLLTLGHALREPREFVYGREDTRRGEGLSYLESPADPMVLEKLRVNLESLRRRLVYLSPLDMEPLPSEANLLATLLVRVREALGTSPSGYEDPKLSLPTLLEEGMDEPWGQIDQLVRDATFMWEDIPVQGQDPRQRAEYQLRAAELYANFQSRFHGAMESVCRHLSRRWSLFNYKDDTERMDAAGGVMLVLPIDNVDRSIQHLHLILKLTRMVASRRLWFLLASGRPEFQLFLERTFQKELNDSARAAAQASGNADETRAIARRQAAAAMRRVLPPAHRIEISLLTPEEVWNFRAPSSLLGRGRTGTFLHLRLHELLESIDLPSSKREDGLTHLSDLFEIRSRVQPPGGVAGPRLLFTEAARLALTMSARTALDLWQSAHSAHEQAKAGPRESLAKEGEWPAITIVHRMLLMSIDESSLPSWASELLLHRIIRGDVQKRTVLDLTGMPIRRLKRTALSDVLEFPLEGMDAPLNPRVVRSELHVRHPQEVILELHDLDRPGRTVPLPPNVAGWFMLLHDLLMLTDEPRVLNLSVLTLDVTPELVVTQHEADLGRYVLSELNIWWMTPEWETFIDFAIFTAQWKAHFLEPHTQWLKDAMRSSDSDVNKARCFRLILAAWVDNVCSVAEASRGGWRRPLASGTVEAPDPFDAQVDAYEAEVAQRVIALAARLGQRADDHRARITRHWLKHSLPLMLNPEFLPRSVAEDFRTRLAKEAKRQRKPEPGPALSDVWKQERHLLELRRRDLVRAAVQRSDAFRRHEELIIRSGAVPGATTARALLLEVCDAWLQGWESAATTRRSRKVARKKPGAADRRAPARDDTVDPVRH